MKRGATLAILLAVPFAASGRDTQRDLQCHFRHPVVDIGSFDELPAQISQYTLLQMDPSGARLTSAQEIAPLGQRFNPTDVLDGLPTRRFIRAGRAGDKWFLWYEHGGLGYAKILVVYSLDGRPAPSVVAHDAYLNENPCDLIDGILDGSVAPKNLETRWW